MELVIFDILARWVHFLAGIVWVGHNYASVAQRPSFVPLTKNDLADGGSEKIMALLNREHGVFRYASVVTWLAGVFLLWRHDQLADAALLKGYGAVIGTGMWIGTMMMLNVWFVLWPHQKKVLGFVAATDDERVRCARVTFLSSRVNTMLSIPLLFFMAASQHGLSLFK